MTPAITNILVATEAGQRAGAALTFAKTVARNVGASLHETTRRAIVRHAAERGADCIVMSDDGGEAVGRNNGVADEVANESGCPVLEVHEHGGVRLHAPWLSDATKPVPNERRHERRPDR
jgi:nucleotide-binding universal stress UspA family protein